MIPICSAPVHTGSGEKKIQVYCCDIQAFDEDIDIQTTSAFIRSYVPTPRSMFGALARMGISSAQLARQPQIDLRSFCNIWLSHEINGPDTRIRRIGCVEFGGVHYGDLDDERSIINLLRSYFQMLDIASTYDIPMETVALPLLGNGDQCISASLMLMPILNECVAFLQRNTSVKRICFVERSPGKAEMVRRVINDSYSLFAQKAQLEAAQQEASLPRKHLAFISYSSGDKNIADNLCFKLESKGIQAWYAPRDVQGPYAQAITKAIGRATLFIPIISANSMTSQHVLNEIDLAFKKLPDKIKFKPLRLDESIFDPSFEYYLARQHWMDAINPPLEERLNEFISKLMLDL